ncbi:MAG: hypothetical protein MGU50_16080 [Trichodesmium sp. MAG_R02]|nr:hypothetical protein [Trichodesmium sp. MAG_R02]
MARNTCLNLKLKQLYLLGYAGFGRLKLTYRSHGSFEQRAGKFERSLRWKISLKNISVGFQQLNQTNRNSGKLKTIKTRIIY